MRSSLLWTKTPEEIKAENARMAEARRQLAIAAPSGGVGMTCGKCGHVDAFDRFIATPIFGQLPPDQFQCPACGWAIERKHGKPTVYASGFVAPGAVTLAPVEARL